ncbi:glycoside hydrolase family 76 protein [Listeria costaricensis]|uniref:glycoside hydrolase family 76 protein n=1 Tax=Listeria costaricensis TaxID=2026604 RepID=UPI0013C4212C|nr:glycoside hydrolase family 76 protein [Listeria costaricensis]
MKKWLSGALLASVLVPFAPIDTEAFTAEQRDQAYEDFTKMYWDSSEAYFYTYSDHEIHSEHAVGPDNGLYTDYWWEAQLFEMELDRYARTGSADSRAMIDQIYDGFYAAYPDFLENDWNDDIGWWARGLIRAYEMTGEERFLTTSKEMFDYIYQFQDETYGGGIWWKNVDVGDGDKNEKNVATNATAVYTAMHLYAATGDASYLDKAESLFAWLEDRFYNDGHILDHISGDDVIYSWDWTYNSGTYATAALELYLETGDVKYLNEANTAVNWAIQNMTSSETLLYEGQDDTGGFKAILTRSLRDLADRAGQTQYEEFLTDNATQAVNHLNQNGIGAYDWTAPTSNTDAIQSLSAAASVAVLMQAKPDDYTGIIEGNGVYEAENAEQNGISSESSQAGFSGRGYLAGWINSGTSVTFHVNVKETSDYTLSFRYSAANGEAIRSLEVEGHEPQNLTFSGTSDWGDWQTREVTVPLSAGSNAITLDLDDTTGSANYLNLDQLTIELHD